jgi:hypothetical protein
VLWECENETGEDADKHPPPAVSDARLHDKRLPRFFVRVS